MAKWTVTTERMPATEGMYFVTREETGVVWMMRYDPQSNEKYPWNDGKGHIYSSVHMVAWMPVEYPVPFSMKEYQEEQSQIAEAEAEKVTNQKQEKRNFGGLGPLSPYKPLTKFKGGGASNKQQFNGGMNQAEIEDQTPAKQSEIKNTTEEMINKLIRDKKSTKRVVEERPLKKKKPSRNHNIVERDIL